ncbi:MAG: MFS transporter [Oculatellaceae cyanobacterium bins.114]|nr:MFS transporter [Oculatellaceae cyanobacterium bins.114]
MMRLSDSDLGMYQPLLSQLDAGTDGTLQPRVGQPEPSQPDVKEHASNGNGHTTTAHSNERSDEPDSSEAPPETSAASAIQELVQAATNSSLPNSSLSDLEPSTEDATEDVANGHASNGRQGESAVLSQNGSHPTLADAPQEPILEEVEHGFLPVLKNRNFLALWSGQVFSQLADKVYLVLMIMIITSRFQAEGQTISGWVSAVMIAFTIPAVLFGSIAGVYVDHWPKKAVLVFTNLLRGGLVLALPMLLWVSQGWAPLAGIPIGFTALLGITFLVSTLTQFFAPAEQAVIPLIVERKHLLSANSLYTTTMMASVIIGFAVGEPLLAIADSLIDQFNAITSPDIGKELLVGFSYAIAGFLLLLLRTNEKADQDDQPPPQVWQNIRDGLRYLQEQSKVRAALTQLVILFSIFAALAVLAVRLAEVMPAIKSSQFGFLLATGGVGMALGAVLIGYFGQRISRTQLSLYGSTGMAASLVGLSLFTERLVPTLLLLACLGAFAAMVGIPMQTAIQEETPEEMRGKVFGLQNNAINIALSLPLALAGVAETYLGLGAVFVGLAILAIAGGVITWSISRAEETKLP